MKYVALLRKINVGTNKRIDMKEHIALFEELGYMQVSTYINSGNVFFSTDEPIPSNLQSLDHSFRTSFGYEIPTLVNTLGQIQEIASSIPSEWHNDEFPRTDVAYLFDEIDTTRLLDKLPFNSNVVHALYVPGAVVWNLSREHYGKSRLNKLIGHPLYRFMTLRNANMARKLATSNR